MLQRVAAKMANRAPVKIVAYGDSISEVGRTPGYFGGAQSAEMNWVHQLQRLLTAQYPAQEFTAASYGIGGQNTYEGLGRLDWLGVYEPDLVLIAFGANDSGWHYLLPEETALALATLVDGIPARYGADVMVLGTAGDNPCASLMRHLDETLAATRAVAEERGVPYVDVRAAVLAATGNGACWTEYHHALQDCHPNDRGHGVWARAVLEVFQREMAAVVAG